MKWSRLYTAAALAGAALGILVVLGVLPRVPHRLIVWMRSVDDSVAAMVVTAAGAVVGLILAAVAHMGVRWQLRRRSKIEI